MVSAERYIVLLCNRLTLKSICHETGVEDFRKSQLFTVAKFSGSFAKDSFERQGKDMIEWRISHPFVGVKARLRATLGSNFSSQHFLAEN